MKTFSYKILFIMLAITGLLISCGSADDAAQFDSQGRKIIHGYIGTVDEDGKLQLTEGDFVLTDENAIAEPLDLPLSASWHQKEVEVDTKNGKYHTFCIGAQCVEACMNHVCWPNCSCETSGY